MFLKKRRINKEIRNYTINITSKTIIYLFTRRSNSLKEVRNYKKERLVKLSPQLRQHPGLGAHFL